MKHNIYKLSLVHVFLGTSSSRRMPRGVSPTQFVVADSLGLLLDGLEEEEEHRKRAASSSSSSLPSSTTGGQQQEGGGGGEEGEEEEEEGGGTRQRSRRRVRTLHACVKPEGEIVLSAGAVYTSVVLFRSGVGPREQINKLGLPVIHEVPQLGRNFTDRIAVPVGVFLTKEQHASFSSPRVSDIVGIRNLGPDCENYK